MTKKLILLSCLIFTLCACQHTTSSQSNESDVTLAQIQTLTPGLSMLQVEEYIGCKGLRDDIPSLVFESADGGYFWLAFFPLDISDSSDPGYFEDKLTTVVFYSSRKEEGTILLPKEKNGEKLPESSIKSHITEKLVHQLSQKLMAIGSFQAVYETFNPEKSATITMLFNKHLEYLLIKFEKPETFEKESYIVFDFSINDGFQMCMLDRKGGNSCTVSFQDLFENLDNPIGAFSFMVKQFESQAEIEPIDLDCQPKTPSLSLGLEEESFVLSMGVSYREDVGPIEVSWLDLELVTKATEVIKSEDAIEFCYNYPHIVSVDRMTGLLLSDSWPDSNQKSRREIILKSHSVLDTDLHYKSYIPFFDDIEIVEFPATQLYEEMYIAYLTDLGRNLCGIENFDKVLLENSEKIKTAARKSGRIMIRNDAKKNGSGRKADTP